MLGAVAFTVVVLAPELVLWQALVPFSRETLKLDDGREFLPPLMFGAAGFMVAVLALRAVLAGRVALVERILTFTYAGAGAAVALWYEASKDRLEAGWVFAGAAMSAPLLWDRILKHLAWRQLLELGVIERPLPRFRILRWVFDFRNTWAAWMLALREGLHTPDEALAALRHERQETYQRELGTPDSNVYIANMLRHHTGGTTSAAHIREPHKESNGDGPLAHHTLSEELPDEDEPECVPVVTAATTRPSVATRRVHQPRNGAGRARLNPDTIVTEVLAGDDKHEVARRHGVSVRTVERRVSAHERVNQARESE